MKYRAILSRAKMTDQPAQNRKVQLGCTGFMERPGGNVSAAIAIAFIELPDKWAVRDVPPVAMSTGVCLTKEKSNAPHPIG
jgi:hypothetical protein